MSSYLETNYAREEYGENDYPQLLCDHLIATVLNRKGPVEGKTLLDIGSGKGSFLHGFARRGLAVSGLDKRDECVHALEGADIRCCDIESDPFPFDANAFDVVFSKSVLEHVASTEHFLAETLRVLRPRGTLVFMVPDWTSQQSHFFDDYTHIRPFTRKGLQNALKMNGFQDVACRYFLQLPLVWKYPWLEPLTALVRLLPSSWRWKDPEESRHRAWVRFSQERMLLATATKGEGAS